MQQARHDDQFGRRAVRWRSRLLSGPVFAVDVEVLAGLLEVPGLLHARVADALAMQRSGQPELVIDLLPSPQVDALLGVLGVAPRNGDVDGVTRAVGRHALTALDP